jgi:DNA polymerase-4
MPLQEARRLCPQAEYVEGNPEKYVALSLRLLDLYLEFTPDVEPFSVDEAFLAITGERDTLDGATRLARALQAEVDRRFGLGATIGVGPNKLIAKMATGVRKPRGLTALGPEAFREWFWPRAVHELWGVGEKLAQRLESLGIRTIGDLAHASPHELEGAFGIIGPQLREAAHGHDDTPLIPYHRGVDPKSMGHEVTLPSDSDDAEHLRGILLRLSDQVGRRLRIEGFRGRTVAVKVRDRRFVTRLRQNTLQELTDDHRVIFEHASRLWRALWKGGDVRLLGVSVSQLERRNESAQGELFARHERELRWRDAMDDLRDRLGEASLIPAGAMASRSRLSHVPFGAVSSRSLDPRHRGRERSSKRSWNPPAS